MQSDNDLLAEARDELIGTTDRPPNPRRAAEIFEIASERGNAAAALRCAVFAAEGLGRPRDWQAALDLLVRAARLGEPTAHEQLRLLAGAPGDESSAADTLRNRIDLESLLTPPQRELLSSISMVAAVKGYAPAGFAGWLVERSRDFLKPALVQVNMTGEFARSSQRTATDATLGPLERDLICCVLQERAARLTGLPVTHHETPTVISYEPGQHYLAHYDFIPPKILALDPDQRIMGQRWATIVTYLNEDFSGACTYFPKLEIKFRGAPGDAVAFSNVKSDGAPDPNTLHAGLPPDSGRKWVLSQWIRSRPLLLR